MDKQKQKVKVRNDLTGKVFGMLTVIEQAEDWICKDGVHRAVGNAVALAKIKRL